MWDGRMSYKAKREDSERKGKEEVNCRVLHGMWMADPPDTSRRNTKIWSAVMRWKLY